MFVLAENPEDTFRISLIEKYQFRPSRTNVRFLPGTATYNIIQSVYSAWLTESIYKSKLIKVKPRLCIFPTHQGNVYVSRLC